MNKYHGISMKLVRIFSEQILIALQALDEIGIIHCDLKPENILLVPSKSFFSLFYFVLSYFVSLGG